MASAASPGPTGSPASYGDTVHQGDLDGVKGVYHINTVDEVTQYEHIGCVQAISERFLLPVLEANLRAYPFPIQGFHTDNGSEYINQRVAALLNKLHIGEFTKSRARKSNDNALVEGKNAAVVRKHLGYDHIPQRFSARVNAFTHDVLSPFLNHHRPCLFPTEQRDHKGKIKKRYRDQDIATPYEKLKSLPNARRSSNPASPSNTDAIAYAQSDLDAARAVNVATNCSNHRLPVGTRRRVTPPSHTARLSQQPPRGSSGPPRHRTAGTTRHRLHSRIDSPPPDLPSYPSSMHPLVLHSTPRTPTRFTSSGAAYGSVASTPARRREGHRRDGSRAAWETGMRAKEPDNAVPGPVRAPAMLPARHRLC